MSDYTEHLISMAGGDGEQDALDLDAIQARADAATEGPWETARHDLSLYVQSKHANLQANLGYVGNRPEPDAEFIAHARTDVPALLALVREQQARIERVEALCVDWDAVVDVFPLTPAALFAGSHAKRVREALEPKP